MWDTIGNAVSSGWTNVGKSIGNLGMTGQGWSTLGSGIANVAGSGLVSGGLAELTGGDFKKGFTTGAIGGLANFGSGFYNPESGWSTDYNYDNTMLGRMFGPKKTNSSVAVQDGVSTIHPIDIPDVTSSSGDGLYSGINTIDAPSVSEYDYSRGLYNVSKEPSMFENLTKGYGMYSDYQKNRGAKESRETEKGLAAQQISYLQQQQREQQAENQYKREARAQTQRNIDEAFSKYY